MDPLVEEDCLVCLARTPLSDALLPEIVARIVAGGRSACCSRLLMVGDSSFARKMFKSLAREMPEAKPERITEQELVGLLAESRSCVYYIVPDGIPLPEALSARDKFCLVADEMRPWPRGLSDADLLGSQTSTPAWTRFFFPESIALQQKLDEVRTIIRNKGDATLPRYILITGETGAGKSFVARHLPWILRDCYDRADMEYEDAARPDRRPLAKFMSGNCASLSPELADSLLFGSVRGAYTGCVGGPGLLETAENGILFLDEVGELPLETQSKLLTALEEREFRRLGDTTSKPTPINCNIIFGTNRDLDKGVALWYKSHGTQGFRPDLLYRINACHLNIPPLRNRLCGDGKDFTTSGRVLLDKLLERSCEETGLQLTAGARAHFESFARTSPWSANFRDLAHIFQLLKVDMLRLRLGDTVAAVTMKRVLDALAVPQPTQDGDSPLQRQTKEGRPVCDRRDIDFVFACARRAPNRAEAGRIYYGDDRNHSDAFGKHIKSYGLRFEASAPDHLVALNPSEEKAN